VRAWSARLTGERHGVVAGEPSLAALPRLGRLATDADPTVRAGVAAAARRMADQDTDGLLTTLAAQPRTADDRSLALLLRRALERRVARDARPLFAWIREHGSDEPRIAAELLHKSVRRLYDTGDPARVDEAVAFLGSIAGREASLVAAGLDALAKSY